MAGLNYVSFNQDHSLLAVATTRGLRIYGTDPFELATYSSDDDISLVEQLFSTSLVAMVTTSPRLLRIVNTKRHSTICEMSFHDTVVAVRMNRKRLVAVTGDAAFFYDISTMYHVHTQETPINPTGICAMSTNAERNYLALPHPQKGSSGQHQQPAHVPQTPKKREPMSGDVLLYDLNNQEEVTVIQAHQTPLSYIAMNEGGTLLATASEKGTVIRVFTVPDGKKLYQFRRGSMPTRIYCMTFNATSTLLCVSSATETVHIFKLAPPSASHAGNANGNSALPASPPSSPRKSSFGGWSSGRERSVSPSTSEDPSESAAFDRDPLAAPAAKTPRQPGFMSFVRRTSQNVSTGLVTRAAGYLPSSVTEMWEPQRDFAWVRVPRSVNGAAVRSVVAMANNVPHVMVATNEGDFYVYTIDLEKGGEGTLIKRYEYANTPKHALSWCLLTCL
ncbi:hypothetical protein BAUCODRAFT_312366 [Baudoinia panamericana UAMH 10762]|uniref:Autophagy-related protein 18 n=1 Tax=Baudoinia panamericana (strain UAMH 10762) TaxID=717646 RepID=M2MKV2_BAUPA|nr:uncharacterized protein BAUCODRAFT_312366 [Baudoinia panamericana UAMH 10762]EMC91963.1 hypothetical protein BAUCODRAFT_312366 [Baudoinia panamericana UAMH 10762]